VVKPLKQHQFAFLLGLQTVIQELHADWQWGSLHTLGHEVDELFVTRMPLIPKYESPPNNDVPDRRPAHRKHQRRQ